MSLATYTTPLNAEGLLNDHKSRYRRRKLRARAHGPRAQSSGAPPAPDAASAPPPQQPAPQVHAAAARWQRICELNHRLTESLDGDGRALWLALEEALHVHWFDVAVDHYQRGYEAGRAQAWADRVLAQASSARDQLRALAAALGEVVDRLDKPHDSH